MARIAKARQSRLRPSPVVLQEALELSATRARLLAKAFGLKVPHSSRGKQLLVSKIAERKKSAAFVRVNVISHGGGKNAPL
jgi:hypothetical protein